MKNYHWSVFFLIAKISMLHTDLWICTNQHQVSVQDCEMEIKDETHHAGRKKFILKMTCWGLLEVLTMHTRLT